jgi:hypothetical protein
MGNPPIKNEDRIILEHHHGNAVKYLFLLAAIIMLISLPLFSSSTLAPTFVSITAILLLVLAAGFSNSEQLWIRWVSLIIAIIGFLIFGTYSVQTYQTHALHTKFFTTNIALAFIFLISVYSTSKNLRMLMYYKKV